MSNKNRIQRLEAAIGNDSNTYWVILPSFEDVDGVQQVRNSSTGETISREEFDKLDIDFDDTIEIIIEVV